MIISLKAALVASALIAPPQHVETFFPRGAPSGTPGCPYPVDGGCAAAPAGGQFFVGSSFWTTAAQSGQSWAGSRPASIDQNLAAIDFSVGHYTADASLVRASTATTAQALQMTVTADNPSGVAGVCKAFNNTTKTIRCDTDLWSGVGHVNPSNGNQFLIDSTSTGTMAAGLRIVFACNPNVNGSYCLAPPLVTGSCGTVGGLPCWTFNGAAITDPSAQSSSTACGYPAQVICSGSVFLDIEHWWFDDAGLSSTGRASTTFKDNKLTTGKNFCTLYGNGTWLVGIPAGNLEASSWDGTFDPSCNSAANMYKDTGDPGLPTQAAFTFHIASGILTVDAMTGSGFISTNQFLDYAGRSAGTQLQLQGNSVDQCQDAGCVGQTFRVTQGPCQRAGDCTTDTSINVSSTTGTTGPQMPSFGYFIAGGGNWTTAHLSYFGSDGFYAFGGGAASGLLAEYFYCKINSFYPNHGACNANLPGTPTASTRPYWTAQFGVAWYPNTSRAGQGTSEFTNFGTTGSANPGPTGWQLQETLATYSHDLFISNSSINNLGIHVSPQPQNVVGALSSSLDQGAGTSFHGIIGTMTWDTNFFSGTYGSLGSCRLDQKLTVGTVVSTGNINLDTGASQSCPDTN